MINYIKIFANILSFIFFTGIIIYYLPSLFELDEKPDTEIEFVKKIKFINYLIIIEKEKEI